MPADEEAVLRLGEEGGRFIELVIDRRRYSVPMEYVERIHRMVEITPVPDAPPPVLGVVDVAGCFLPVLDLQLRLGHGSSPLRPEDRLVMLKDGERRILVPVDRVVGVFEVPRHRLEPPPEPVPRDVPVAAVCERDEEPVLLLDLPKLFSPEVWVAPDAMGDGDHPESPDEQ